jgi:hypothetical protein
LAAIGSYYDASIDFSETRGWGAPIFGKPLKMKYFAYGSNMSTPRLRERVSIRTDFLKDVPVDDDRFVTLTAMTSQFLSSTYAWEGDARAKAIDLAPWRRPRTALSGSGGEN